MHRPHRRHMHHAPVLVILAACVLPACAPRVPEQAVELSMSVGEGITTMQVAHEALVSEYFALSRQRVQDFLQQRWIPEFLDSFVGQSGVLDLLTDPPSLSVAQEERLRTEFAQALSLSGNELERTLAAVRSGLGGAERGQIMLDFAGAAMEQIELQRVELMRPIEKLEREVLRGLRANYAELLQLQSSVTAHIQSVRDVVVEQDAVLTRLGLLRTRDSLVANALALNDEVVRATEGAEAATDIVTKLKDLLEVEDEEESPDQPD